MHDKEYTVFDKEGELAVRISEGALWEIIGEREPAKNPDAVIHNVNQTKAHKCGSLTIIELRQKKRTIDPRIGGNLDAPRTRNPFILKARNVY